MIIFLHMICIIVGVGMLVYTFMKVLELLIFENTTKQESPGDCPKCENPLYTNWHGADWLEYRCSKCDYILMYKRRDGRWRLVK